MSPLSPGRSSHLNTIQTAPSPQPVQGPFSPETRFCEVDHKYHHTLQTGSWAHFPAIALSSLVASTLLLPLLFLLLLGFLFCSSASASPPYYSPSTSFCIYRQSSSFQRYFGFSRKKASPTSFWSWSPIPGKGDDLETCSSVSRESMRKDRGPHG